MYRTTNRGSEGQVDEFDISGSDESDEEMERFEQAMNVRSRTMDPSVSPGGARRVRASIFLNILGEQLLFFLLPIYLVNIFTATETPIDNPESGKQDEVQSYAPLYSTFLPIALFGFMAQFGNMFNFGLARAVSRANRLQAVRLMLPLYWLAFVLAGFTTLVLEDYSKNGASSPKLVGTYAFLLLCMLSWGFGSVGLQMTLENDWLPVVTGHNTSILEEENHPIRSQCRNYRLGCGFFIPLCFGFILAYGDRKITMLCVSLFGIVVMLLQFWLLTSVYNNMLELRASKEHLEGSIGAAGDPNNEGDSRHSNEKAGAMTAESALSGGVSSRSQTFRNRWVQFTASPVFVACFSRAMIHMSVLGSGVILLAFIVQNYESSFAGLIFALMVFLEIGVGVVCLRFCDRYGTITVAKIFLILDAFFAALAMILFLIEQTFLGILCVVLSYSMLAGYDGGHQKMVFQRVQEGLRKSTFSMEATLSAMFTMLILLVSMFVSNPTEFKYLGILSVIATVFGLALFVFWSSGNSYQHAHHVQVDEHAAHRTEHSDIVELPDREAGHQNINLND